MYEHGRMLCVLLSYVRTLFKILKYVAGKAVSSTRTLPDEGLDGLLCLS